MAKLERKLVFSDGAVFVIVSSNPRSLYTQYCSLLKRQKHPNKEMQDAYNKNGKPRYEKEG